VMRSLRRPYPSLPRTKHNLRGLCRLHLQGPPLLHCPNPMHRPTRPSGWPAPGHIGPSEGPPRLVCPVFLLTAWLPLSTGGGGFVNRVGDTARLPWLMVLNVWGATRSSSK
jgi:hypothetical protein